MLYAMSGNGPRSRDRREYVFIFCVLSCLTCENLFQSVNVHSATQFNLQAEPPDNPLSMRRQKSKSVSTQQFLSFKCQHCKYEFESSRAYRNHRTHQTSQDTPCSLEKNKFELLLLSVMIKQLDCWGSSQSGARN